MEDATPCNALLFGHEQTFPMKIFTGKSQDRGHMGQCDREVLSGIAMLGCSLGHSLASV